MDRFIQLYNSFCDFNRLPKINISASLVKERYQIVSKRIPLQILRRKANKSYKKQPKFLIDQTKV